MKPLDSRFAIGAALVVLGGLMLLERVGLFPGATQAFWAGVFLVGAAYFLYRFAGDRRGEWWAVIPGSALAGLGIESALPAFLGDWHGMFFLAVLGLGFYAVYLTGRERWWALIPGGVLVTLGVVAGLTNRFGGGDSGGVLFVGLGLTFLLVAVLANMGWAYIPGVLLLAFGALIGSAFSGALDLVWPAILVIAGVMLVIRFWRKT